jgi:predicted PurR-regulated permease PerM
MGVAEPHEGAGGKPASGEFSYVEKALGLALILALIAGCFLVLRPFLAAILLAIVLCISTWPTFKRIERLLGGRQTLAAATMMLITACVLIVPLGVLGSHLVENISRLSDAIHSVGEQGLPPPPWLGRLPLVGGEAERVWLDVSQRGVDFKQAIAPYIAPGRDWALRQGGEVVAGTLQAGLSIVLAFFLYRDGVYAERRLEMAMRRLAGRRAGRLLKVAADTITSVVRGVLGTALIQGILLGLSFRLAGVPGAFVLGGLGMVLSLVPLGLALLWLPAGLWLMSGGHTGWAIFVLVWNGLFVGSLDNLLRPYLISRGVQMPMVLIFLGVVGGVLTFGFLGIFLGPILLAVAYSLVQDWDAMTEDPDGPDLAVVDVGKEHRQNIAHRS